MFCNNVGGFMKKKSILKGASFFLATFAFCGVMALGAKYISPRHEVNTTIETQIAYAEELATLDKTLWNSFKNDNGENCYYNVTKIVTLTNETDTTGATQIGENAYARISGDTLSIFSTNSSKIILPADCSYFFNKSGETEIFGKVTEMDLSSFDTSNVTNMEQMFEFCFGLTSLDLRGLDTSKVTNMAGMFCWCASLKRLDLSNFDTSNVTNMGFMFTMCFGLEELNLQGFDTSKVTDMGNMFAFTGLSEIDLSMFNTSNVERMSEMFWGERDAIDDILNDFESYTGLHINYEGSSLRTLNLSNFDTSNLRVCSEMFKGCNQLYKLDISSFDLSNVTNASQVFAGCTNLRKIYLPRVVSDSVNIDLPYTYHTQSWNYSGSYLNDFRYTLSDDSTKRFIVTDSVESQEAVIDRTEWDKFKNDNFNSDIKKIVTKKAYEQYSSMTSLGENVYAYINGYTCEIYTRLDTKILLPEDCAAFFRDLEHITEIDLSACDASEVTNMNAMFYGCRSLETINFGENFNTSKVTNMSAMFAECYNLQSADLTSFNTANVENMFQMFYMCSSLNDINLSNLVTTKTTNMSAMFYGCLNLDEIDLPELDTSAVTTIEVMFYGCNSLKVVDLSSFDLTNVNTNKLFDGCENLSMIYLPKALPQGYDVEFGSDLVLASNHAVKGSTLNAFAGYESTAGQKNAIVKGGEVNVVVDTQFADVISTGEEIEYYYGDEIVVNGTTLIIGGVSVQVIPNEVEGYEITFAGWEGIENGVVVGDTITAILTKTPINYTITMIVNGQNNTRTYNIETNTFTLEEPEGGEEEEFVGWTWEGQEVPVKDLEILKGSIGDRTVKANFAPKIYTITINVDGEITTIDYTKGSDDIVIKDPSSSGLIFDGWVDENGNKVDENVIKSGSTGDRYFKATWKKSPMLKYVAIGVLAFVGVAVATEIIVGVLVKKKKK